MECFFPSFFFPLFFSGEGVLAISGDKARVPYISWSLLDWIWQWDKNLTLSSRIKVDMTKLFKRVHLCVSSFTSSISFQLSTRYCHIKNMPEATWVVRSCSWKPNPSFFMKCVLWKKILLVRAMLLLSTPAWISPLASLTWRQLQA